MARGVVANRVLRLLVFQLTAILFFVSLLTTVVPQKTQAVVSDDYRWTKTVGIESGTNVYGGSVVSDSQNNTYSAGNFQGTATFDGPGGSDTITRGPWSIFITKRSSAGVYNWTKSLETTFGVGYAQVSDLAIDGQDSLYVAGYFSGTVTFDGPGGSDTFYAGNPGPDKNAFLTKYSSNGDYQWTRVFDTTAGDAICRTVAVDSQNNIYIAGNFSGSVIFDGEGGSDVRDGGPDGNAFITKFTGGGDYGWTRSFSFDALESYASAYSLTTDNLNNVYISGSFYGTVIFDGEGGSDTRQELGESTFFTKYSSGGSYQWTRAFDIGEIDSASYVFDIVSDSQDNLYITGGFNGTVTFDGEGGSDIRIGAPQGSSYLTRYNSSGDYGWTKTAYIQEEDQNSYIQGVSIGVDSEDNVYVTGGFYGSVTFDGESGSDTVTLPENNYSSFLTKYNANGTYGWTKTFGLNPPAIHSVYSNSVTVDSLDNIYMLGYFSGTVTFDGEGGSDTQGVPIDLATAFLTSYGAISEGGNIPGEDSTPGQNQIITSNDIGQIFSGSGGEETGVAETTTPKTNENILPNPDGANLETAPIKNKGSNLYKWLLGAVGTMIVLYLLFWRKRHNQQEE